MLSIPGRDGFPDECGIGDGLDYLTNSVKWMGTVSHYYPLYFVFEVYDETSQYFEAFSSLLRIRGLRQDLRFASMSGNQ